MIPILVLYVVNVSLSPIYLLRPSAVPNHIFPSGQRAIERTLLFESPLAVLNFVQSSPSKREAHAEVPTHIFPAPSFVIVYTELLGIFVAVLELVYLVQLEPSN